MRVRIQRRISVPGCTLYIPKVSPRVGGLACWPSALLGLIQSIEQSSSSSPTDSESSEVIEVVVETFARSSLLLLSRYLEMIY